MRSITFNYLNLQHSQQNPQTQFTHTDSNDPLPTPQLTNANSLTGLQNRQRAPLKHSHRCLENHTRTDSFTSETSDEEADYGSFDIDANRHNLQIRIMHGVYNENDGQD